MCRKLVPRKYVDDYEAFPPVVASTIGFSGHGKTVYFGSLWSVLRSALLGSAWPGFYTMALDDASLSNVLNAVRSLEQGALPKPTPEVFGEPTLIRLANVSGIPNCTLCIYDVAGEVFRSGHTIAQNANFVRRAHAVLFLISLWDVRRDNANFDHELHRLLNSYIIAMSDMGARTKDQDLIVVYTKADVLEPHLNNWGALRSYITSESPTELRDVPHYLQEQHRISNELARFTDQNAPQFRGLAEGEFRSVRFCLVSSLGAEPINQRLSMTIAPRRVVDPLLYVLAGKRAGSKSKVRAIAPRNIMRPSVVRALAVVAVLALLAAGAPFAYWGLSKWSKQTNTVSKRNPNTNENNSISLSSPQTNEAIRSLANESIALDDAVSQGGLSVSDGLAGTSESQLRAIQFSAAEYSIEQSVVESSVVSDDSQAAQMVSINSGDYYRLAVLTRLVWFDQFYRKREIQLPEGAHIHYLKSFVGDDGQAWASVEIHPQWDVSQATIFGSILESDLTSQALIEVEPFPTASSDSTIAY